MIRHGSHSLGWTRTGSRVLHYTPFAACCEKQPQCGQCYTLDVMHSYCLPPYAAVLFAVFVLPGVSHALDRFEEAPVRYSVSPASNPITRLQASLDAGNLRLEHDDRFGYLPALLRALEIPTESQALVFSKTSLQNSAISPETPRALYFNDDVYIGTVQNGSVLEVSTADPILGTVFYTLSQRSDTPPRFERQGDTCLQCHGSTMTRNIPGHLVRSLYVAEDGFPILKAGTFLTTQESPFEERWGGWYVTGTHGDMRHMGNVIATETTDGATLDPEAGANRAALPERVAPDRYLTGHSDIVALLVLEHQTRMHNLLTQANYDARFALHDEAVIDEMTGDTSNALRDNTKRRIMNIGDKVVDHMLFVDEAPLTSAVQGTAGFAEYFAQQGLRDRQGRSLRTFDLTTRLFKYPLSYLIYSPQFDGLPKEMRRYLYWRLHQILGGRDTSPRYAHLTPDLRATLTEILRDTKPELNTLLREP